MTTTAVLAEDPAEIARELLRRNTWTGEDAELAWCVLSDLEGDLYDAINLRIAYDHAERTAELFLD